LNIVVPGESTYYRAQSTVCEAILELPAKSCAGGFGATFGDRHGRQLEPTPNASHCVVDFFDVISGKIVDFEIIKQPIGFSDGDSFHSSHGMSFERVWRMVN
jgi:hypothetical protein